MINEIYILDEKLSLLSTIDEFYNVTLENNFYEIDTFNIDLEFRIVRDTQSVEYKKYKDIYDSLASMYENGIYKPRYLCTDFDEMSTIHGKEVDEYKRLYIIESFEIDELDAKLSIKGSGFLSLFEKRYTKEETYSGYTVGKVLCKVINDNDKPKFLVADENENDKGEIISISTEIDNNVYEVISELVEIYELGFNTLIDYKGNTGNSKVYFNVLEKGSKIHTSVSVDDGNITGNVYELDTGSHYNYCKVIGKYNETRVIVYVSSEGWQEVQVESALELVLEAKENKDESITLEEYKEVLKKEGEKELSKNKAEDHFDVDIKDDVVVNLGDLVIVKINVGYKEVVKEMLVTSIEHTFDKREYKKKVGFGKPFNLSEELKKSLKISK